MKKIITLALAAVFGLAVFSHYAQAQPKADDPQIVWGYEEDWETGTYTQFVPPSFALASDANFYIMVGATGVNFGVKDDNYEVDASQINATLMVDVEVNGASVYTHPDTICDAYWDEYDGTQFGRLNMFGYYAPLPDGEQTVLQPGHYKATFTLLRVTAQAVPGDWGDEIVFTSAETWNGQDGQPITMVYEFDLIGDPEISIEAPVLTSSEPCVVYDLDDVPAFKINFAEADKMGTQYVVVAEVRHMATRNMKDFYDTITTAEGLNYTFPANWRERYGEDPNDEDDQVPEEDHYGNPMIDNHSLTFHLLIGNNGEYTDITPKEALPGTITMYFMDKNLTPSVEWDNVNIKEKSKSYDYDTWEEVESWAIFAYSEDAVFPKVVDGVFGEGPGACVMVLSLMDGENNEVYTTEFNFKPWQINFPGTLAEGTYTIGLYLKMGKEDGTFEPVFVDGELVRAAYWLVLGNGEFPSENPVYNPDIEEPVEPDPAANEKNVLAGVKVYPNPNSGMFYVTAPEAATVEVYGLNGALISRQQTGAGVKAMRINRSGIYFIRVSAGNRTAVQRVMVR